MNSTPPKSRTTSVSSPPAWSMVSRVLIRTIWAASALTDEVTILAVTTPPSRVTSTMLSVGLSICDLPATFSGRRHR